MAVATARTALFSRHQPGGVYVIDDVAEHPGGVFFVDSTHANKVNAVGAGRSPDKPWSTLAYAFSSDVLTAGDVVYVMPGHTEAIAAARTIIMDIAGVKVVGLGWGSKRPTFTFTTVAGANIEINAIALWLENLLFVAAFTNGVTVGIDVLTASDD